MYNAQYQLRVGYDAGAIRRFTAGSRPEADITGAANFAPWDNSPHEKGRAECPL
jgi:hypothetical protein